MKNSIHAQRISKRIPLFPTTLHRNQKPPDRIAIPMAHEIEMLKVEEIVYFKSESNYTHIYLLDGRHLIASMTLKLFEEHLKGGDFLRVHNQYMVHGKFISSYIQSTNKVVLSNKLEIPVSRNKRTAMLEYLKSYMIQTS